MGLSDSFTTILSVGSATVYLSATGGHCIHCLIERFLRSAEREVREIEADAESLVRSVEVDMSQVFHAGYAEDFGD